MRILVCIKQVPGTAKVDVDEKTGVLKRDTAETKMNPFDLFAIEEGLKIREKYGGNVDVLTMGPSQAEAVLVEAVWMGADRGILLSDRNFAGADVAATSYTIVQGIRKMGDYDLIICGKQTTDGDTAQTGPEAAEFLQIEHISNVLEIERKEGGRLVVLENQDDCVRKLEIPLPCLITVEKNANTPRLPSLKRALTEKQIEIIKLELRDLPDTDTNHYGLTGSPTQVERIFPPEKKETKQMFEGNAGQIAAKFKEILTEQKFV